MGQENRGSAPDTASTTALRCGAASPGSNWRNQTPTGAVGETQPLWQMGRRIRYRDLTIGRNRDPALNLTNQVLIYDQTDLTIGPNPTLQF